MYARLNENDQLDVDNKPLEIFKKSRSFVYKLYMEDDVDKENALFLTAPRNWMTAWTPEQKARAHVWPIQSSTFDNERFHQTFINTYSFDGATVFESVGFIQKPEPQGTDDYKRRAYLKVDGEGAALILAAETTPAVGIDFTNNERSRQRATIKRDNKTKKNGNNSAADDHLYDHIDLINDAIDSISDEIEAAADYDAVDAIISTLDVNANWPTWLPI